MAVKKLKQAPSPTPAPKPVKKAVPSPVAAPEGAPPLPAPVKLCRPCQKGKHKRCRRKPTIPAYKSKVCRCDEMIHAYASMAHGIATEVDNAIVEGREPFTPKKVVKKASGPARLSTEEINRLPTADERWAARRARYALTDEERAELHAKIKASAPKGKCSDCGGKGLPITAPFKGDWDNPIPWPHCFDCSMARLGRWTRVYLVCFERMEKLLGHEKAVKLAERALDNEDVLRQIENKLGLGK